MRNTIRNLSNLMDEIPEEIEVLTVQNNGQVHIFDGVKKLADIFGTSVTPRKRESEIFPYQFETTIEGITFFEFVEEVNLFSGLEPKQAPLSVVPKELGDQIFELLLERNSSVESAKISYRAHEKGIKLFVTVEYDGRDDRVIYDRFLREQDITRIMTYEPKSFTTKLGRLLIQLVKLYPYKESITLRRKS